MGAAWREVSEITVILTVTRNEEVNKYSLEGVLHIRNVNEYQAQRLAEAGPFMLTTII